MVGLSSSEDNLFFSPTEPWGSVMKVTDGTSPHEIGAYPMNNGAPGIKG